jgi:hypothetical protein
MSNIVTAQRRRAVARPLATCEDDRVHPDAYGDAETWIVTHQSSPERKEKEHDGLTRCPGSVEQVDSERDRESERRHHPDQLAAVLVGLGHHRVREHREDRTCREGEDEGDGAR